MSTSEPRVPLAATINLPGSQRTIQVNHCKMPDCSNFGVPARTEKGKPGPSADRDMNYKVHSTAKGTIPAVRCKACLDLPPIKSNASIRAEVERLAEASGIWTLEESTGCSNDGCGNHHRPIAFHPEEYRKRGKVKKGDGQYYECKRCGRRFLVSDPLRLHDNSRRYAVDILSRIANKSPVRGSVRGARLKSFDSYYPILDFIYRRCRAYSGRVDRALMDGRMKLPGVFAPNCKHRQRIVPRREPEQSEPGQPLAPMAWMQRLKRVFAIDIETCPKCGGTLRVIACIEDPDVIATILEHIRARDKAEPSQPRAPPLRAEHPDTSSQHRLF